MDTILVDHDDRTENMRGVLVLVLMSEVRGE